MQTLDTIIRDMQKNPSKPFFICDRQLFEKVFPAVQKLYPKAKAITYGTIQCVIISEEARLELISSLHLTKMAHEKSIAEIISILKVL